jgi:hypothetical protein
VEEEVIADFCKTNPNLEKQEQEFSISFTKDMESASVCSTISSQCKRLLKHTDVNVTQISTLNTDTLFYKDMDPEEFEGGENMIVWGVSARVPIESIKIQANPRSARSYAQIISEQGEVNIDG